MAKKIKVKVFDDLRESLQDVLAFKQGREVNLRVVHRPAKKWSDDAMAKVPPGKHWR